MKAISLNRCIKRMLIDFLNSLDTMPKEIITADLPQKTEEK